MLDGSFAILVLMIALMAIQLVRGYGAYRMAVHAGLLRPWLALLPFCDLWIIGLLAERSITARAGSSRPLAVWLMALFWGGLGGMLLCGLLIELDWYEARGLAVLLELVWTFGTGGMHLYALYHLFRDYAPGDQVVYTLLSAMFRIGFILLFILRDTVPVSVAGSPRAKARPRYDKEHSWSFPPPPAPGTPAITTGPEWYQQQRGGKDRRHRKKKTKKKGG